jgi:hypothetical protein
LAPAYYHPHGQWAPPRCRTTWMGRAAIRTVTTSSLQPCPTQAPSLIFTPDQRGVLHLGHREGKTAIFYVCRGKQWLVWQEVRGCADGHKMLQAPCTAAAVHQHKGVLCVGLQVCNQLPH